jgi:predicted amidohydrolase YtcJ
MPSTTLYKKGTIYTLDRGRPRAEAIVVRDGRILDLGSNDDMVLQWGRADVKQVDLAGGMVIPGLIDSHLHLSATGLKLISLDLSGVGSKQAMLASIRHKAREIKPGEWLIGRGWNEKLFSDGGLPVMEELDQAAPHCPMFLTRICGHAFLANTRAFERCGVTYESTIPVGGEISWDEGTKNPTGLVLETASRLFQEHIPPVQGEKLKHAVRLAIQHSLEHGLTSVHTEDLRYLGGLEQTYQIYQELLFGEEQLGLRCNLLIYYPFLQALIENGMFAGYGNETLQIGALKLFADGAIGRRTAKLSQPYADAPAETGQLVLEEEELRDIVRRGRAHHMPIAAHVIGDGALEVVLNALDQVAPVRYPDRLIHNQIIQPAHLERLKHPSRIADIQPRFVVGDFPWVIDRVGAERIKYSYAWKTMLDAGIRCAGGSDAPVEPVDPLLGIHAAMTRRAPSDTDHQGWNPAEKLEFSEALALFTIGGAYATREEQVKGTLAPGKYADMTVYSKDLFALEADEMLTAKVMKTIIGGKVCYERGV